MGKNGKIADGGMFASIALGIPLEDDEAVQLYLFDPYDYEGPMLHTEARREGYRKKFGLPEGSIVYFMQDLSPGRFIKIGHSSDISLRYPVYQTHNPYGVELIGFMYGNAEIEDRLHRRFAHHHFRGEWFYPGDDLLEFIEENSDR